MQQMAELWHSTAGVETFNLCTYGRWMMMMHDVAMEPLLDIGGYLLFLLLCVVF